jgi:TetR/AcrR family transcriptional regulator, cholesterol catabolism regulator
MTAQPPPEQSPRLPIGGTSLQNRIADAAIELFYSQGATATSVRDITSACGLTPGALYNHFSSKEQLLYVLIRDVHVVADQGLAAAIAAAGPRPAAQLAGAVRFMVWRAAGPRKQSQVANREYTRLARASRDEIKAIRRRMRARFADILLAGSQAGDFVLPGSQDRVSAALTATAIATLCANISEWTRENYPVPLADLQDRYVEMALRLAGAPPEIAPPQTAPPSGATGQ